MEPGGGDRRYWAHKGRSAMNFFDSEFARYARSTIKRRRGWAFVAAVLVSWVIVIAIGFGAYELITRL